MTRSTKRRSKYTAAEIFLAILGGLFLVLIVGMVATAVLGG